MFRNTWAGSSHPGFWTPLPAILLRVIGHDGYFTAVSRAVTTVQGAKNKETFYFSMYVYMVCVHTHTYVGSYGCLCVNVHVCGSLGLMFRVSPHLMCEEGPLTKAGAFVSCGLASQPHRGSVTLPPRSGTGVMHMLTWLYHGFRIQIQVLTIAWEELYLPSHAPALRFY